VCALHRTTVVIVEDDAEMRIVLRAFLERAGYAALEYENAMRARADIEQRSFAAVILDKEMPGFDGLDFLAFLHGRYPTIPVIIFTAFGGPAVRATALARGAARYIEKPCRIGDVVDAIRSLLA
jgi:DNA-binding NtrC family response regulator